MSATTLVIMAAGIGSRYGGIKQLEPVGPSGEIIMDYSIYDAIDAGFNKIVFIIRRDIEKDFKEVGDRIARHVNVEYVFQDLDFLPAGFETQKDEANLGVLGMRFYAVRTLLMNLLQLLMQMIITERKLFVLSMNS